MLMKAVIISCLFVVKFQPWRQRRLLRLLLLLLLIFPMKM